MVGRTFPMGKGRAWSLDLFPPLPLQSRQMNDLFVIKLRPRLGLWLCWSIQQSFALCLAKK